MFAGDIGGAMAEGRCSTSGNSEAVKIGCEPAPKRVPSLPNVTKGRLDYATVMAVRKMGNGNCGRLRRDQLRVMLWVA